MPTEKKRAVCGAKARHGGFCQIPAGRGTKHLGEGRCKLHGGNNGAKQGNKNALKSGRYETIFADVLEDDEIGIMAEAAAKDNITHLEEEIALTTVREHRMLSRIAKLRDAESGMTLVEESTEILEAGDGEQREVSDAILAKLEPDEVDRVVGTGEVGAKVTKIKQKRTGTLGQIQAIEADLTAVQAHKARLIKQLHEIKNPEQRLRLAHTGPDGGPVEVKDALPDELRAAGVAALLARRREAADGQVPGADAGDLAASGGPPA